MLNNITLKGALAFFLVIIASGMVVLWMIMPPTGDAAQIGLLAGFVTLFIKMAADAIGYQYNSSSGSDKKDDTQAAVAGALANKVPVMTATTAVVNTPAVTSWWTRLTDEETTKIMAAGETDAEVKAFIVAAKESKASPAELVKLVSKGLLTPERAKTIQAT